MLSVLLLACSDDSSSKTTAACERQADASSLSMTADVQADQIVIEYTDGSEPRGGFSAPVRQVAYSGLLSWTRDLEGRIRGVLLLPDRFGEPTFVGLKVDSKPCHVSGANGYGVAISGDTDILVEAQTGNEHLRIEATSEQLTIEGSATFGVVVSK